MKTILIGKAGSGKTTIYKSLMTSGLYSVCIETDKLVADFYNTKQAIDFFKTTMNLSEAIVDNKICKDKLIQILINNIKVKTELENFIFNNLIAVHLNNNYSILVDGVPPRFIKFFDQIIEVSISEKKRIHNLKNRGVSEKRINEINKLQEKWI